MGRWTGARPIQRGAFGVWPTAGALYDREERPAALGCAESSQLRGGSGVPDEEAACRWGLTVCGTEGRQQCRDLCIRARERKGHFPKDHGQARPPYQPLDHRGGLLSTDATTATGADEGDRGDSGGGSVSNGCSQLHGDSRSGAQRMAVGQGQEVRYRGYGTFFEAGRPSQLVDLASNRRGAWWGELPTPCWRLALVLPSRPPDRRPRRPPTGDHGVGGGGAARSPAAVLGDVPLRVRDAVAAHLAKGGVCRCRVNALGSEQLVGCVHAGGRAAAAACTAAACARRGATDGDEAAGVGACTARASRAVATGAVPAAAAAYEVAVIVAADDISHCGEYEVLPYGHDARGWGSGGGGGGQPRPWHVGLGPRRPVWGREGGAVPRACVEDEPCDGAASGAGCWGAPVPDVDLAVGWPWADLLVRVASVDPRKEAEEADTSRAR